MANLKDIKLRIEGVTKTQQITRAMKMVATSKMKKATEAITSTRPYAEKMNSLIGNLFSDANAFGNQFAEVRDVNTVLLLVVAADKGLCGGFNNNIRKMTNAKVAQFKADKINVSIISVGRKAVEICRKIEDVEIVAEHPNVFGKLVFDTASMLSGELKDAFSNGSADRVELVYNRFVNAMTQAPTNEQFLPLQVEVPEKEEKSSEESSHRTDYIYEPNRVELISSLIPRHLNMSIWKALLDSNAAEQAARMMAMDSATENAGDLIDSMNLTYNNLRQAKITSELAEIVSGAAALNG